MFVQPRFVFAGKAGAYPSEAPFRCFIGISLLETEPTPISDKSGETYILSTDSLMRYTQSLDNKNNQFIQSSNLSNNLSSLV